MNPGAADGKLSAFITFQFVRSGVMGTDQAGKEKDKKDKNNTDQTKETYISVILKHRSFTGSLQASDSYNPVLNQP